MINVGAIGNLNELETLCDLSVRALDEIIELQDYFGESGRSIY